MCSSLLLFWINSSAPKKYSVRDFKERFYSCFHHFYKWLSFISHCKYILKALHDIYCNTNICMHVYNFSVSFILGNCKKTWFVPMLQVKTSVSLLFWRIKKIIFRAKTNFHTVYKPAHVAKRCRCDLQDGTGSKTHFQDDWYDRNSGPNYRRPDDI